MGREEEVSPEEVKRLVQERGVNDAAMELHGRLRGKVRIRPAVELTDESLETLYTPGVGAVSERLAEEPGAAPELTWRGNAVAVISDGSAVLGLGDEGPEAALPVLEGKALLFQALAGIDAVPLALQVDSSDALVQAVKALAPTFGAINLEDIKAPGCFEVERRLRDELDVPVLHDDQHGTAVVVLAALVGAARVTDRDLKDSRAVIVGAGAGGAATARLLRAYGLQRLAITDRQGGIARSRDDLDGPKRTLADELELDEEGSLEELVDDADILIGLSVAEAFSIDHVRRMAENPIVLALANPTPEVDPDEARQCGAAVVATGRSDYPNQVNNVLAFPGLFRGALDGGLAGFDESALLRAAEALSHIIEQPSAEEILPSVFDERVVPAVAGAVSGDD